MGHGLGIHRENRLTADLLRLQGVGRNQNQILIVDVGVLTAAMHHKPKPAIAIPIVVSSRADVLAVPFHLPAAQWIGLAVLFLVGWLIYRTGKYAKA